MRGLKDFSLSIIVLLPSDVRHNHGLSLVLYYDPEGVVKVGRIEPGGVLGRCVAEQHHVLTDHVKWHDDGLADD